MARAFAPVPHTRNPRRQDRLKRRGARGQLPARIAGAWAGSLVAPNRL